MGKQMHGSNSTKTTNSSVWWEDREEKIVPLVEIKVLAPNSIVHVEADKCAVIQLDNGDKLYLIGK